MTHSIHSKRGRRRAWVSAFALAATAGALLIIPSCTVTEPGGRKWSVGPLERPGPSNGTKVGEFCVNGKCYDLIDTNGDGVPDFAVDPTTGQWYPIKPVGPGYQVPTHPGGPANPSQPTGAKPIGNGGGNGGTKQNGPDDPGNEWWRRGLGDRIQFGSGWGGLPYNFLGMTADEWITATGLDTDPGVWTETDAAELHLFNTDTLYTEVTLFTTGEFKMPNVLTFPGLQYEIYGLHNERVGGDDFYAFNLRGDLRQVLNFALSMDDLRYTQSIFEFENMGMQWQIIADRPSKMAALYCNGQFVQSISLP